MKIFAISDLHLSFSSGKPMDVFGPEWERHDEKIRETWLRLVSPEDIVILPGDLSWGLKLNEAEADFRWVHRPVSYTHLDVYKRQR